MQVIRYCTLFWLLGVSMSLKGQTEIGGFLGFSNYSGDLTEKVNGFPFNPREFSPSVGIFVKRQLNHFISLRGQITYGNLKGNDSNATELAYQKRNLQFKSILLEGCITAEFDIIRSIFKEYEGSFPSPALFVGVGGFYFNPRAKYNDKWYSLQPLGTEGQILPGGNKYSRISFAIPIGLRFNYKVSQGMRMGFEMSARKTFTDYIDDVSTNYPDLIALKEVNTLSAVLSYRTPEYYLHQGNNQVDYPLIETGAKRGSSTSKDWYYFVGVNFAFPLHPDKLKF